MIDKKAKIGIIRRTVRLDRLAQLSQQDRRRGSLHSSFEARRRPLRRSHSLRESRSGFYPQESAGKDVSIGRDGG